LNTWCSLVFVNELQSGCPVSPLTVMMTVSQQLQTPKLGSTYGAIFFSPTSGLIN
jgi:hypothetical protein